MRGRLSEATLRDLPSAITKPAYDRHAVRPGIVHLGVGAFHRAHQAVYVDDCLAAGDLGWGIEGVSLRSADTRDALEPQDGLYTLAVRGGDRESLRAVGSLLSLHVAPENPPAVLELLTDPRIRIVTLTVTEKAYLRGAGGDLDTAHHDVAADLAEPGQPKTAHGFLVEALARRRSAGVAPLTVLCCDNLPANGATLHRLLVQFAELRDVELARYVAEEVACPSTMVDRIVPATTEADRARIAMQLGVEDAWPVMTEPFCQWVVEDHFPAGRPRWEEFGVTMTGDVTPYEEMKLRLLNGSHSAIAYLGLLSGYETVSAAFADPAIRGFVEGLWREAIPTLPHGAGLGPQNYTRRLADRFANTALAHRTAQIANDGSQKLPQRILAAASQRIAERKPAGHLMLVVAAWIAAAEARGDKLPPGYFTDPLDRQLAGSGGAERPAREKAEAVFRLAGFGQDDPGREELVNIAADHLERLRGKGPTATMAALSSAGAQT
jgi:fructuronate reductase